MTIHPRATIVPFHDDILAVAARHIIDHGTALPDLTATTVLLPDLQFAPRLRRHLLDAARHRGHAALLGPAISTLDEWLCDQTRIKQVIPGRARRELLLVEVLQQHPSVFGGSDPWQISASLVTLFDELTLNRVQVPQDLDAFTRQLQTAYGIGDRLPEPLGMEASVVHRLWQAWHVQLGAEDLLDPGIACLQRLAMTRDGPASGHLYLVGFDDLSTAREEWLAGLLASGRVHCFLYPRAHTPDDIAASPVWTPPDQDTLSGSDSNPVAGCLDAVFRFGAASPGERARAYITQQPDSPLRGHFSILTANSAEQEARAIDLQVRRWLLEQRQPVGIVTGDRRLARRVRALLERAGVSLQDSGGWALSTTSTAAALERWLETVEEDFAHQPLLDVLKSPFVFPDDDREQLGNTVFRLEQDIILHENIARGLARYRKHIELRRERLPASWTSDATQALQILLNRLDQAADPLRPFIGNTCARPAAILEQLRVSLESLGMWAAFDNDLAGQRILGEWQLLYDAAQHSEVEMSWIEFRAWFGTALERHNFRPATAGSPVLLLTLEQAQLGQYGGVIVGACDREHLPAVSAHSPFFNDPVRRELGLPVWPEHYACQLNRFRRVLESAPAVLLTWHQEDNGEPRMPGPWLEAIRTFHRLAWGNDLADPGLEALLDDPAARIRGRHPLPQPLAAGYPAPSLPANSLPTTLSVSAHRTLIDCPYRFFAGYGLRLKPRESVKEALEKAEYGSLVHQALETFHKAPEEAPGAFGQPVTEKNRDLAIAALERISQEIFTRALEDTVEHRAWLRRWRVLIPEYIKWQIRQQQAWQFSAAEQEGEFGLGNGRTLRGRLDRIDRGVPGMAILDYKTGAVPKQTEVDQGEDVQLASYALLTPTLPARVEYLKVDQQVRAGPRIEGETLADLAEQTRERLTGMLAAIEAGDALPAWGDTGTCRYCEMDGLCRRQAWLVEPAAVAKASKS